MYRFSPKNFKKETSLFRSVEIKNYCTVWRITLATWPIDFLPINQLLCLPSYTNHFKTIKTKRISITFLAKCTLISANATFTLRGDLKNLERNGFSIVANSLKRI